jgi:hypothetical protein
MQPADEGLIVAGNRSPVLAGSENVLRRETGRANSTNEPCAQSAVDSSPTRLAAAQPITVDPLSDRSILFRSKSQR